MEKIIKYVGKNAPAKIVKKALVALQKQQAGNKHFDIKYKTSGGNDFVVIPKTEEAAYIESRIMGQHITLIKSNVESGRRKNIRKDNGTQRGKWR